MVYLDQILHTFYFNIVQPLVCKTFSDLYRIALFGMNILAEALQNFISVHAAIQTQVSLMKFNYFIK